MWTLLWLLGVATAATCTGASAGDHLLVNMSVSSADVEWSLNTWYHVNIDEGLLSEALLGSCPGDERRFSTAVAKLHAELDLQSRALDLVESFASGLVTVSVVVQHTTSRSDYAVIEALESEDYGAAVRLVNEESRGINARDKFGITTLMIAVVRDQPVLAGTLLNAWSPRVDVNARTPEGFTALHYAIAADNLSLVRALLRRGADVNARILQQDSGGWTPLHFACKLNLDAVKLLLDFGANPLALGFANETVFQVAEDADLPYTARKKLATMLNDAVLKGRTDL